MCVAASISPARQTVLAYAKISQYMQNFASEHGPYAQFLAGSWWPAGWDSPPLVKLLFDCDNGHLPENVRTDVAEAVNLHEKDPESIPSLQRTISDCVIASFYED